MSGESVERLMDVILQMRLNLAHINETLQQQSFEICQQLAVVFDDQKRGLEDCLKGIDAKLTECSVAIADYRRLYDSLTVMREKLVRLGAEPSVLPVAVAMDGVDGFIAWRLRELKEQSKL
jgi:hypothetical protein